MHDRHQRLAKIHGSLISLSQLILGPNAVVQGALSDILNNTPQSFYEFVNGSLENHANILYESFKKTPGLNPIKPQGAMYMMVEILIDMFRDISDERDFCQKLLTEEMVSVLPGSCFMAPNFFRVVICAPPPVLQQVTQRLTLFCQNHCK